jgi:hypothetical protein
MKMYSSFSWRSCVRERRRRARASAAAVEVEVAVVGCVWERVLKGGRASQFWASRWGVAEGNEMVSARVGLEVRRFAAGEAGVRKEWVRWSRMWPSR